MSRFFLTAKDLLQDAENELLGGPALPKPLAWLRQEFWNPLSYVMHGTSFFIDNFSKILFYSALFSLIAAAASTKLGLSGPQVNANLVIALLGAFFVVLFSLPSTFAHFGLKEAQITYLSQRIQDVLQTKAELDALKESLEAMEACTADRVRALRWAMATLWGAILFGYSQSMAVFTRLATQEQIGELMSGSIVFFITVCFFGLIPLIGIAGYRRANDLVFRGLQFACIEVAMEFSAALMAEDGA